jgi:hypothetical protein
MRLGTWETWDFITNAGYHWAKESVGNTGGRARIVMNHHDFGSYPSIEVDKPFGLKECDEECGECEECDAFNKWVDKIGDIEQVYSMTFGDKEVEEYNPNFIDKRKEVADAIDHGASLSELEDIVGDGDMIEHLV